MSEFSVIIPTLQRSKELQALVEQCAAHPLVLEVLVINNAPAPLVWLSPKVRVLQQDVNIYVNPAWNLGAREARGRFLAIINDDVLFDSAVFNYATKWLEDDSVGVVGVNPDCYTHAGATAPSLDARVKKRPHGFGVVMFMQRRKYIPVPSGLRVYFGDDWFVRMVPAAHTFSGIRLHTEMSVTSGMAEFSPLAHTDIHWERLNMWRFGTIRQRVASSATTARYLAVGVARRLGFGPVLEVAKRAR